jgi:hypothetical protein
MAGNGTLGTTLESDDAHPVSGCTLYRSVLNRFIHERRVR